jgi:hypothetical protein
MRILHTVPCARSVRHACASAGPVLASVAGQKSRRPKFVGIAEVLGLPARQRHQPCLGVQRVRRSAGPSDDAPPERPSYRKRKGLPDRPEYPRPLDPDRRLGSRLGDRFYFADAAATLPSPISRSISPIMTTFMESVVLGSFRGPGNPIRRC